MAITKSEGAKRQIIKRLREQGYATYATLVGFFDIFLTDNPDVVGYMMPGEAYIVLNRNLNLRQVSTIVRHEVLHEYLTHGPRQQKFDKEHPELNPHLAPHQLSNIAADFEISNKGYTTDDKNNARALELGPNKIVRALVTEDDHPDWVDLSYEEMYQKLLEIDKEDRQQLKDLLDKLDSVSQKDLDGMMDDLNDMSDSSDASNKQKGSAGSGSNDSQKDDEKSDNGSPSSEGDSNPSDDQQEGNIEKAKKIVKELKKDLSDANERAKKSDGVFDTPKEQRDKVDVAARAEQIRDFINDTKQAKQIEKETSAPIEREKAEKEARDIARYMGKGIQQFKMSLNRFIYSQIEDQGEEEDTYRLLDRRYEDSDFLMPGKITPQNKQVPLINVYHDVSGSFDSAAKTEGALKALETLNRYVRNGDIEIKVYYFADKVSDNKESAGGGTEGTPILDHVEKTRPTNVIVITDGDISDCNRVVKVPGAVWMLFYPNQPGENAAPYRSQNLMDHLKGRKENRYYDIYY